MSSQAPNQGEILSQVIQLYEFSLAVGNHRNLHENCRHFFDRILARKNLSYVALWMQNPIDKPFVDFTLAYSDPANEYQGPEIIQKNAQILKTISEQQIFSITLDQILSMDWPEKDILPNGDSFTFVNLPDIGFILLAGYGNRGLWLDWQLSQIMPIFQSFATSLRANIQFEQLQVEIMERKVAENKARQASEIKGQFLANMSHELRTPLNAVLGMSQLLEDTQLDKEQTELVSTIVSSGHSLLNLINDILDFSKLEANKVKLEHRTFDLGQLVNDINLTFRKDCARKNLTFRSHTDDALGSYFVGDALRIKQVLYNIISNAIKFTAEGSIQFEVKLVSAKNNIARINFSVKDSGIGIQEKNMKNLFKSFHQLDASITRKFGGTGLGLSISKQLVELMQGTMHVRSQFHHGSEFYFEVPLTMTDEASLMQQNQQDKGRQPKLERESRILLVEDDQFNQLVAQKFLTKMSCTVDIAQTGIEAIEKLKSNKYDLVFMDMQMPEMGGLEATKIIRDSAPTELNPNINIIAMTANAQDSDRQLCLDAGMNDYLSKPIDKNILQQKLEKWL